MNIDYRFLFTNNLIYREILQDVYILLIYTLFINKHLYFVF